MESELDHVFVGFSDQDPIPDEAEADGWHWIALDELRTRLEERPCEFSVWLRKALDQFETPPVIVASE